MVEVIRNATEDDLPQLATVERRADLAFAAHPGLIPADGSTVDLATLESAARHRRLWLAEQDGEVIGFALVIEVAGVAHLEQIAVIPEHHGQGFGTKLLDTAVAWAADQGHLAITLSTFADVAWNRPFYERRGFVVMTESELSEELHQLRIVETRAGLDVSQRVMMKRTLRKA